MLVKLDGRIAMLELNETTEKTATSTASKDISLLTVAFSTKRGSDAVIGLFKPRAL